MIQKYIRAYRSRGDPVNSIITISVAKVLIAHNLHFNLEHIDLDYSSWAKSLFKRNGLAQRMKTNGKVEIPEVARKEAELMYLHNIVAIVEENKTPRNFIMNLDQKPLKSHLTMAKKGVKSVSITGSSDKRCITSTFVIPLEEDFLPLQLIYGSKTKRSVPRYKFPESFSLSVNPKHFSNTKELTKVIEKIVLP